MDKRLIPKSIDVGGKTHQYTWYYSPKATPPIRPGPSSSFCTGRVSGATMVWRPSVPASATPFGKIPSAFQPSCSSPNAPQLRIGPSTTICSTPNWRPFLRTTNRPKAHLPHWTFHGRLRHLALGRNQGPIPRRTRAHLRRRRSRRHPENRGCTPRQPLAMEATPPACAPWPTCPYGPSTAEATASCRTKRPAHGRGGESRGNIKYADSKASITTRGTPPTRAKK